MKKTIFSLFILGLYVAGHAQDITHIQPDFSTDLDGWVSADSTPLGADQHWQRTNYARVQSDENLVQNEWLISNSFGLIDDVDGTLGEDTTYSVTFDYFISGNSSDAHLYILLSEDNGATWPVEADYATSNIGGVDILNDGTNQWISQTVTVPNDVNGTGRLAFVFYTDVEDHGVTFAIDNIQLDSTHTSGVTSTPILGQDFETAPGITSKSWTTSSNSDATELWSNYYHTAIYEDQDDDQLEWFFSPKVYLQEAALTNYFLDIEYYAKNEFNGVQGVTLKVKTNSDPDWDQHDISYQGMGSNFVYSSNYDLVNNLGINVNDSIQFALVFNSTAGDPEDFYLNAFHVYQVFNEGSVIEDANISLDPYDVVVYPNNTKYNVDFKEGFWTVAPDGWTLTNTSEANWRRTGWVSNHDYSAYIDTIGANAAPMNETLTSESITISYPSVGASYLLSFDWRTETNLNAGTNTDPLLGSGVDYDFADIKMEIRTNGGTWTQIWQEDDQAVLDATTLTTSDSYHNNWNGFQDYLDNPGLWYTATIDLNSYISPVTTSLEIRVNYTGDGMYGGYFNIDNLYVLQTQNPEFDFEATEPFSVSSNFLTNYSRIPVSQINNPYQLGALITNNGVSSFNDNNLFAYVNTDYAGEETFGYRVLTPALLPSNSTNYITVNNLSSTFAGGMNFAEGSHYELRYSVSDLNGNAFNESLNFDVTTNEFRKHTGGVDNYVTTDGTSGGIGTLFEFKNNDVIDQITVFLGDVSNTSDFNLSVIKVTSPSATSGTLIYNSPLVLMTNDYSTYYFNDNLNITAGYYIFMFNQLDGNNLYIGYDDDTYTDGVIYRGNASNIYADGEEVAELMVSIIVEENETPEIATTITNDEIIITANDSVEMVFVATDANNDTLVWNLDYAGPAWLTDWIIFTDNGDGTATLSGKPETTHLGTSDITVAVNDGRGGYDSYSFTIKEATQAAVFNPDYYEYFNGSGVPTNWVSVKDQMETGSDYHWDIYYDDGDNKMNIFGDSDEKQDEWIISPPIYLANNAAKGLDTSYRLEFDWQVYNFNYFCLGIPGVLGSAGNGGYNYADVTLMVSTDNGLTWSAPIWKEDDPDLVAPVTDGILGGEKWGYTSNYTYTSKINLSNYVGDTILFAFRYQGNSADYWQNSFNINNFYVLRNKEVDISVIAFRDYQYLPERQVDQVNGEKFYAYIINQGITVPEGATYTLKLPEVGYQETFELTDAFFATGDTQMVEYTYFPQANVNQWYYFTASVDADGNATSGMISHQEETYIHSNLMRLECSANVEEQSYGYYDGLGVGYELKNADHLYYIYGYFGPSSHSSTPISISIIKVENYGDTSGELIATIDDNNGSQLYINAGGGGYNFYPMNDQDYGDNLFLQPGKYIFMFNQLDENKPLFIYKSNTSYHFNKYYRGNFSEMYQDEYDQGHLYTNLYFDSNDAPRFVDENENTITTFAAEVLNGESGIFAIYADDYDEFDMLSFEQVTDPSFLAPTWLSFTFDTDTAYMTIAATAPVGEYPAQLMVGDGVDTTTLSLTITINGPQFMADEFYEPFNNWTENNYPKVTTNDNTWMLKKGDNSESTVDWNYYSADTRINSDNSYYQNEWLISPYIYFNAPSNDTTYWLSFNWYIENVSKMIGGTKDVIGSGDEFNDFNYADLRVKVSTDGGDTWTLLWQEDDETLVEAANPDIIYPYVSNYYYNKYYSSIDITSFAGQPLLFGFQYEGQSACAVGLDNIEIERVDPYVDLEITRYDVLPYYLPIKQAKNIDMKMTITNWGTAPSVATTIAAQVTNSGGNLNPAYEETLPMASLASGASMEYTFPAANATYGQYNWNYNFYFDIYAPYNISNSYSTIVSMDTYGYDRGTVNGYVSSEAGKGLGQVFQIFEEDLLTRMYLYCATNYNYLVIDIVKLENANATSGELVYSSSPQYYYYSWQYLDIEDVTLEPGYYAILVKDSEDNETFQLGYNSYTGVNAGTYIKGDASEFEVVEQASYLNFRLIFDNAAPYFANAEGSSINLEDEMAMVGIKFEKFVRAIDNDEDDTPVVEGLTLPEWVTVKDTNGFYLITGTPTVDDLGENLVVLRATDGTTYDQDDFVITVEENPAPIFISAPGLYAFVGKSYSYQASAIDKYGDVVNLTATLPSWLSVTGSGSTITISGTPGASNVGESTVKVLATDNNGMTTQQLFTILVVANSVPEFVSSPITSGTIGVEYSYYIAANDANSSDVLTITAPTLPSWLTLSATGNGRATLMGTPTAGGTFNVVIVATDAVGANATQSFSISVEGNSTPAFTSTAITAATEDVLYTYEVTTTDSDGDYMYFIAEVLPNWLVLTVSGNGTASLQGIPTQQYVGNNAVSLAVGDGVGKTTQNFTIVVAEVNDAPMIISTGINNAVAGTSYQYEVEGFDEEGASLEFEAQLPTWLTLTDDFTGKALISGIPTEENVGDYDITVMVTDGVLSTEQVFTLSVSGVTDVAGLDKKLVAIYPNPSTGKFYLSHAEGATIQIFNITGELVYHSNKALQTEQIDLSAYSAGNYTVKIILNDKVVNKTIHIIK